MENRENQILCPSCNSWVYEFDETKLAKSKTLNPKHFKPLYDYPKPTLKQFIKCPRCFDTFNFLQAVIYAYETAKESYEIKHRKKWGNKIPKDTECYSV